MRLLGFVGYLFAMYLMSFSVLAMNEVQQKPIVITKKLVQKISKLKPNTSNSSSIEKMIGPAAACLPVDLSPEAWVCQWKGKLSSSGVANTLNVSFEAGMVTSIIAIDATGNYIKK